MNEIPFQAQEKPCRKDNSPSKRCVSMFLMWVAILAQETEEVPLMTVKISKRTLHKEIEEGSGELNKRQ